DQVTAATNKASEANTRFGNEEKSKAAAEAQLKQLQDSNAQLAAANAQTRADLDKLTAAQGDLQGKNTALNQQLDQTNADLATSEAARKEALDKNKAQSDEIARLNQDKETAEKGLAAAAAKEKDLSEQNDMQATMLARYKAEKGPLSGGKTSA